MDASRSPPMSQSEQQTSSLQTNDLIDGTCLSVQVAELDLDSDLSASTSSSEPDRVDAGDAVRPVGPVVISSPNFYEGDCIYKMSAAQRGICLIINNIKFINQDFDRLGSEKDGESLTEIFAQLGFTIHYLENLTASEMIAAFQESSRMDEHRDADCFVSIILTHGHKQNTLYGTDHMMVSLDEDLISQFNNANCPHLIRKPKLFFVQACRGDIRDSGVCLQNVADAAGFSTTTEKAILEAKLPSWSDTLICYSTIDGYVSLRNVNTGSWFVDALSRELCEHACDTDLHNLLIKVNNKLMLREGDSALKQSLEVVYRGWSRSFYFNPGHYSV